MDQLTKHFQRSEFACQGKDCCDRSAPIDMVLVCALEQLRAAVERPLVIESGFRCRRHNAEIGGSPDSYHTLGMAADVRVPEGWTPEQFARAAERIPVSVFQSGGIGIYSHWVHLDIRKEAARWKKI